MLDSCAQSAVTMGGSPESLDNRCSESPGWHGLHIRHDHPPALSQTSHKPDTLYVTCHGSWEYSRPVSHLFLSPLRSQEWADGRDGRLAPPGDSLCTGAWWLTSWQSRQNACYTCQLHLCKYSPVSSKESEGERSVEKWSDRDVTHQSSWAKYLLLFAPCLPSIKYRNASLRQYKQFNHFGKLEASHINQWVISDGETGHAKCRESDKLRKMFLSVLTPSSIKTSRYI